jgi:hypothetical protein
MVSRRWSLMQRKEPAFARLFPALADVLFRRTVSARQQNE